MILYLLLAATLFTSEIYVNHSEETTNSIDEIVNDMKLPHEARPHGVPDDMSWSKKPRIAMGNEPGDWTAMITWGQVYESAAGNKATNTRVEIRNIQAWYLSKKDNKWHLWQKTKAVNGAAYREDFAHDTNKPADLEVTPDCTVTITCGDGYNFHFWPTTGRVSIDPDDIAGVFSTVQARLVLDNAEGPDDRDQAEYLLSMGADYWVALDTGWNYWKTNGDCGIGRFKYVTEDWKAFNMHTMTEKEIRKNPPPIE